MLTSLFVSLVLPMQAAQVGGESIIPNGDFSQGNVGFSSALPYAKPADNCLWPRGYTIAASFNDPQLHRLIAPQPFGAPVKHSGREKVFFANADGTEDMVLWSANVSCRPNTRYLISFNSMSMTGHMQGNPPYQVADPEWVPDFEISANDVVSPPFHAGQGVWYHGSMAWDSRDSTTVTVKIIRAKMDHWGAIIGISNIDMVPMKS